MGRYLKNKMIKTALKYSLFVCLGIFIGVLSALWMSGLVGGHRPKLAATVVVDNWTADWAIGAKGATPYMRAFVARYGLLALPKTEAVYFVRTVDDDGDALVSSCDYRVSGEAQMAKWWSITLYNDKGYLAASEGDAYSIDQTGLGDGSWSAEVSAKEGLNKSSLLSSKNVDRFELLLRIYKPDAELLEFPHKNLRPPSILRLSCQSEAP